jgi:autotransporter-associated beta strand protein
VAGALQVGNGGTTGSISGNVTNDGTLAFNRADDLAFGGAITGSGSLVKQGAGRLTLDGANDAAGTTDIQAGALELHGSIAGDVHVGPAAVFDVQHLLGGAAYRVNSSHSLVNEGSVAGPVETEGFVTGTGTVNGSMAVLTGGSISAGLTGTPGALTINGPLTLAAGATLTAEIAGPTTLNLTDLLVSSSVSLSQTGAGVTLNLALLPGYQLEATGAVFFLVDNTGAGSVSGSFANPTTMMSFGAGFGGETFTLLNDPIGGNHAQFAISYDANFATGTFHGGNDIALMAVPEPAAATSLMIGLAALAGLPRFRRRR